MAGYTARLCSAPWSPPVAGKAGSSPLLRPLGSARRRQSRLLAFAPPFGLRPSPAKPAPPSSQHELAAMERLRESGGRCRLDPAQAQHRAEGVLAEPALVALGPEDRHEMGDLLPARLLAERHVRVRPAEVEAASPTGFAEAF